MEFPNAWVAGGFIALVVACLMMLGLLAVVLLDPWRPRGVVAATATLDDLLE